MDGDVLMVKTHKVKSVKCPAKKMKPATHVNTLGPIDHKIEEEINFSAIIIGVLMGVAVAYALCKTAL